MWRGWIQKDKDMGSSRMERRAQDDVETSQEAAMQRPRDQQVQIETGVWGQNLRDKENSFTWLQKDMFKKKYETD